MQLEGNAVIQFRASKDSGNVWNNNNKQTSSLFKMLSFSLFTLQQSSCFQNSSKKVLFVTNLKTNEHPWSKVSLQDQTPIVLFFQSLHYPQYHHLHNTCAKAICLSTGVLFLIISTMNILFILFQSLPHKGQILIPDPTTTKTPEERCSIT